MEVSSLCFNMTKSITRGILKMPETKNILHIEVLGCMFDGHVSVCCGSATQLANYKSYF